MSKVSYNLNPTLTTQVLCTWTTEGEAKSYVYYYYGNALDALIRAPDNVVWSGMRDFKMEVLDS